MHFKKKQILNNVDLVKLLKLKNRYNLFFLRKKINFFFFLNKLFNSIMVCGKKNVSINIYLKLFNLVIFKKRTLKKSLKFYLYFLKIALKLLPCFLYINFYQKGKVLLLPWLRKKSFLNRKKLTILAVGWLKKSISNRKEKTYFLKFFSEIESIRTGKSASIELKNIYYKNFYQNKRFIKFIKKNKTWT